MTARRTQPDRLDDRLLTVPAGVLLDLGATAKAVAADRAAARAADRLGAGVLVALGGDVATAGPHHILDPRSGRPAPQVWRTVSVAAFSCLRANTLSTAAVVRGERALRWLRDLDAPARFVTVDRGVLRTGGWPS
jgi:thiamine biosynthesis lipoprotein